MSWAKRVPLPSRGLARKGVRMRFSFVCFLTVALCSVSATAGQGVFSGLPLSFEPNLGQANPSAQFVARGAGYAISLQRNGIEMRVRGKDRDSLSTIRFSGGSSNAPQTSGRLPGDVNYFVGSDRKKWHAGVPTFATVTYPKVYPGIDVVYYGTQGQLEFDFRVHPGGAASNIRLSFTGATPRMDANGDLLVGDLRQHKPVAYQLSADNQRTDVAARYQVQGPAIATSGCSTWFVAPNSA